MSRPLAVDTHIAVATNWNWQYEVTLNRNRSGRQREQRIQASTVGSKFSNLVAGNHGTDFAGIGLHSNRIRFDGHILGRGAHFQGKVDTRAVVDVQNDVALVGHAEARGLSAHVVVANRQCRDHILSVAIGDAGATLRSLDVRNGNGNVRYGGAAWIRNRSDDGGILAKGTK